MEEKNATNDDKSLSILHVVDNVKDENIFIEEKPFQKFIKTKGVYIAMATTVLGLFIGVPLLFWFASVTVISIGIIMVLIFACGALGLLQWKYVRDFLDMEYHQFSMYAFTGFGMCLINLILSLNYFVPITTHTEIYTISRIGFYNQSYEITLAGDYSSALEGSLGNYFNDHYKAISLPKMVTVIFDTGLFGFDIIRDCKFN